MKSAESILQKYWGYENFRPQQLNIINARKIIALDHSEISIYNLKKNLLKHKKIQFVLGDMLDQKMLENTIQKYKVDPLIESLRN